MRPVSGRDLLLAFALGVEIECRLGNAISPEHYARGWHITSTCGTLGAAAAGGKLLSLDTERMIWAIGAAATQTGGLVECLGTPTKSLSVGNAARNGLWSALLAERGFSGPPAPIEGRQGYLSALAPSTIDWLALTNGLGETWELAKNTYKPYPAASSSTRLSMQHSHCARSPDLRLKPSSASWFAAIRSSPRAPTAQM